AVLGAGAGLHREQGAELDGVGPVVLAVDALGPMDELGERQIIKCPDLGEGPVVARLFLHGRGLPREPPLSQALGCASATGAHSRPFQALLVSRSWRRPLLPPVSSWSAPPEPPCGPSPASHRW